MKNTLPTFEESEKAVLSGTFTPLEAFIAANEVVDGDKVWRHQLLRAIKEAYQAGWNDRESDLLMAADRILPPDPKVAALAPLVAIANAYDANELDDEARKHWGTDHGDGRKFNTTPPDQIELYAGRGGKRLLTLADCFAAREAVK